MFSYFFHHWIYPRKQHTRDSVNKITPVVVSAKLYKLEHGAVFWVFDSENPVFCVFNITWSCVSYYRVGLFISSKYCF